MIHCRVTKINAERFQVDLTCRTSDLEYREGKYRYKKGLNWYLREFFLLTNVYMYS